MTGATSTSSGRLPPDLVAARDPSILPTRGALRVLQVPKHKVSEPPIPPCFFLDRNTSKLSTPPPVAHLKISTPVWRNPTAPLPQCLCAPRLRPHESALCWVSFASFALHSVFFDLHSTQQSATITREIITSARRA